MTKFNELNTAMNDLTEKELTVFAPFLKPLALYNYARSNFNEIHLTTWLQLESTTGKLWAVLALKTWKVDKVGVDTAKRLYTAKLALLEALNVANYEIANIIIEMNAKGK